MFALGIPWWELIVRSAVVYAFLLVILRVTGKRQVGQLAPFDLVGQPAHRMQASLHTSWKRWW